MKYAKKVILWGYVIYRNGNIIGLNGKQIKNNRQIDVKINGANINKIVSRARFIYYAFHQDTFDFYDNTLVIIHKNKNKNDYNIKNLKVMRKRDILQGENHSMAKLTDKQVKEIINIYNNKDMSEDKNNPITNISYRKLAKMYGVSHSMINGIVNGKFRNKDNYIIK